MYLFFAGRSLFSREFRKISLPVEIQTFFGLMFVWLHLEIPKKNRNQRVFDKTSTGFKRSYGPHFSKITNNAKLGRKFCQLCIFWQNHNFYKCMKYFLTRSYKIIAKNFAKMCIFFNEGYHFIYFKTELGKQNAR